MEAQPSTEPTQTKPNEPAEPANAVELGGESYTIEPCQALAGVQVVFLLARYARATAPLVSQFAREAPRTAAGGVDYLAIAGDVVAALGPLAEQAPGDLFRMLGLLSNIEQATLERARFTDLLPLFAALSRANNLAGFYAAALQA